MSRENEYNAFVLKRTDFGETDQIITVFSEEEGKLRALVKAAKLPTSKLQPSLQPLFRVKIRTAGNGSLPKVIGAQIQQTFPGFYEDPAKLECWYLASELLTKGLGDGSPNQELFSLLSDYLNFINNHGLSGEQVTASLIQFQIKALAALGLGIKMVNGEPEALWFSLSNGGFVTTDRGVDALPVATGEYVLFERLAQREFNECLHITQMPKQLQRLVNQFVTYQLERELKTVQYLNRS